MELGKDVYRDGRIGVEMTDELCRVLNDFVRIMKGYRVDDWRVCATSAVREAGNQLLLLHSCETPYRSGSGSSLKCITAFYGL